ncbi:putative polypeptide N-acetylgalactosaminyltransferase 9 [Galendromus occidentalis]|uniref:Polypeptide N-acetylgalactosaminyltransferase n=1 Tax=Galendromus occidentalis TaxID=34638 RepID=A0AAJ7SGY0_9ACAR|nr:putative polypeptide N-acetylgalactosaminyltransferase 9 [Galendromus occidentalis]
MLMRRIHRGGVMWKLGGAMVFSWLLLTLFASTHKDIIEDANHVFQPQQAPVQPQELNDVADEPLDNAEERRPPLAIRRDHKQGPWALPQNKLDEGQGVIALPGDVNAPGENGKGVIVPTNLTGDAKRRLDIGWQNNAFNQYASDMISLHRSLPDMRDPGCKTQKFRRDLPQTSVIICFHNEAWSVLMRTVHSVIDRSPKNLLKEIILVDDFSDMKHLKEQLEDYTRKLGIVKIVRASKREGLIRARLLGAKFATAPVLTYLDSHCECSTGWLEPLLDRIAEADTNVVCPVIDVISDSTFEYPHRRAGYTVNVGGFDWNLQFSWHSLPQRDKDARKQSWSAVPSPTMAGGLFSISKAYFEKLGLYDSGFDIWGAENLELSFKVWMCGGRLEIVPCSHVGHVFRKRSPYKWLKGVNVLKKNSVRLAKVWMDEYAQYYFDRIGPDLGDYGDISERVELRRSLNCKSFDWYVKNIYPDLFIPGDAAASGEVRNSGFERKWCLDSAATVHATVSVYPCHGQGGNQYWLFSKTGEIRRDELCLDYSGGDVVLYSCHGSKGNQYWRYDPMTKQLRHGSSEKCLAINEYKTGVTMETCGPTSRQQWNFVNYNASKIIED